MVIVILKDYKKIKFPKSIFFEHDEKHKMFFIKVDNQVAMIPDDNVLCIGTEKSFCEVKYE